MKKIIIIGLCITLLVVISGCISSSYEDCYRDCKYLYKEHNCSVPDMDFFEEGWCYDNEVKLMEEHCFNECK